MSNTPTASRTIADWPFPIGLWFCILGLKTVALAFTWTLTLNDYWQGYFGLWYDRIWPSLAILTGSGFFAAGFVLLQRKYNSRTVITWTAFGMLLFAALTNGHDYLFPATGYYAPERPELIGRIILGLALPIGLLWFSSLAHTFTKPLLAALSFVLVMISIQSMGSPVMKLIMETLGYIQYCIANGDSLSSLFLILMSSLLYGCFSSFFPFLYIVCAILIHNHPTSIRIIRILFWILGIIIAVVSGFISWSGFYWGWLDYIDFLRVIGNGIDTTYRYLAPIIITLIVTIRYNEAIRILIIQIRNSSGCIYCGYNLTGNTSGRCPECGNTIPEHQLTVLQQTPDKS